MSTPNPVAPGRAHALKRYVDSLISALPERAGAGDEQFGLVYLGNVHDAIPRLLILDKALRLEERCVWQVMRVNITDPGRPASLLTQPQLSHQCCVDVKTLRLYLHCLRATRWITRCALVIGRGTIWALQDEPLSLADTLELDPDYMQFIDKCAVSRHKRLRDLGQGILETLRNDIRNGVDFSQPVTQLEQAASRLDAQIDTPRVVSKGSFFSIETPVITENCSNVERRAILPVGGYRAICPVESELSTGQIALHGRKFFPEEKSPGGVEKLPCGSSSSFKDLNNLKTTTTTKTNLNQNNTNTREENFSTPPGDFSEAQGNFSERFKNEQSPLSVTTPQPKLAKPHHPEWISRLKWPTRLKERERAMVLPALTARDFDTAQYLLDYLSDRLQAASRGEAKPVPNPVAYLTHIATLHARGNLMPSSWGVRGQQVPAAEALAPTKTVPGTNEAFSQNIADLKSKFRWN